MKVRYKIILGFLGISVLLYGIANSIIQIVVDRFLGDIVSKVLCAIVTTEIGIALFWLIITSGSIIGYLLGRRRKNQEHKAGFRICILLCIVGLVSFIVKYFILK